MTLTEWFKINPNHKVTLVESASGGVRALLHGGSGIDQRLVGEGADESVAVRHALDNREKLKAALP